MYVYMRDIIPSYVYARILNVYNMANDETSKVCLAIFPRLLFFLLQIPNRIVKLFSVEIFHFQPPIYNIIITIKSTCFVRQTFITRCLAYTYTHTHQATINPIVCVAIKGARRKKAKDEEREIEWAGERGQTQERKINSWKERSTDEHTKR